MSNDKMGGPAFPTLAANQDAFVNPHDGEGMTLWDYYAAAALQGIMANPERWKQIAEDYKSGKKSYGECSESNAVKAGSIADAMLAERNRRLNDVQ